MSRRRVIACCDGTSKDSESGNNPLTNVARISRCIKAQDEDKGVEQVVYYVPGVGTGTSWFNNKYDAIIGRGISQDIRQVYSFICNNISDKDDEIVLIGFSRGAFTARTVASLINDVGLLTKRGLRHLPSLYELWKNAPRDSKSPDKKHETQEDHKCKEAQEKQSTQGDQKGEDGQKKSKNPLEALCDRLENDLQLRKHMSIKACAVWDTVAALGPRMLAVIPQPAARKLSFVNSELCENIELAVHALALDEDRRHFKPLLWEGIKQRKRQETKQEPKKQTLRQCWFRGTHSDVGGGHEDIGLANISLAWMIGQLRNVIKFDDESICDITTDDTELIDIRNHEMRADDQKYLFSVNMPVSYVREGIVTVQTTPFTRLQGVTGDWRLRTPDRYQKNLEAHLQGSTECIHSSVHTLYEKKLVHQSLGLRELKREDGRYTMGDLKIEEAQQSDFEKGLLATWTTRKLVRRLLLQTGGKGAEDKREVREAVPIFAMLYSPQDWSIRSHPDGLLDDAHHQDQSKHGYIGIHVEGRRANETGSEKKDENGPVNPAPLVKTGSSVASSVPGASCLKSMLRPSTWLRLLSKETTCLSGKVVVPVSNDRKPQLYRAPNLDNGPRVDVPILRSPSRSPGRGESSRQEMTGGLYIAGESGGRSQEAEIR